MINRANVQVGCLLVGEYIDEAESRTDLVCHQGEVVRTQVVGNYLDLWSTDNATREFTVLLKDGRIVTVHGHGLKQWPSAVPGESGSYGVIIHTVGEEVVVAMFKALEVVGIFHGEMRSDRKID